MFNSKLVGKVAMHCRACGAEMVATENCPSCNEAVLWKCPSCEKENDRSVHTYHANNSSRAASLLWAALSMMSGAYTFVIV